MVKSPAFDPSTTLDPKISQAMENYKRQREMLGEIADNPNSTEAPITPPFE